MSAWKNSGSGRHGSKPCPRCGEESENRVAFQIAVRAGGAFKKGTPIVAQRTRTICEPCAQEVFALATDSLLEDAS